MGNLVAFNQEVMMPSQVKAQVGLIHQVMNEIMQKGQHYGVIPGCGTKPSLLKPGAEKILTTFRLVVDPEIEDLSREYNGNRYVRYRIKCKIRTLDETLVGTGVGECSSLEEKYQWRKTRSKQEYEEAPENQKRIKYGSNKYGPYEEKQVRQNAADIANTILKMAKKRALVDACLTVTAASDIFTQDIEDFSELAPEERPSETVSEPEPDFSKSSDVNKNNGGEKAEQKKMSVDEKLNSLYKHLAEAYTVDKLSTLWNKNKDFVRGLPFMEQNAVKSAFNIKKEELKTIESTEAPETTEESEQAGQAETSEETTTAEDKSPSTEKEEKTDLQQPHSRWTEEES